MISVAISHAVYRLEAVCGVCHKFIRVPKGKGALSPMRLRDWQTDLVGSVLDVDPQPRTAGWMLPHGEGKSSLVAALGLYNLFERGEGAVVWSGERWCLGIHPGPADSL